MQDLNIRNVYKWNKFDIIFKFQLFDKKKLENIRKYNNIHINKIVVEKSAIIYSKQSRD